MVSWIRWCFALAPLVAAGGAAATGASWLLPDGEQVASGVTLDGTAIAPEASAESAVRARAEALLDRRLAFRHEGRTVLQASLRDLGAHIDEDAVASALRAVGRQGSLAERIDQAWQARRGELGVALPVRLALEPLAEALAALKETSDRAPIAARWDFEADAVVPHQVGLLVDVPSAAEAALEAARAGRTEVDLPVDGIEPRATLERVAAVDRSAVLSRYETRFAFAGGEANRAGNIERAAAAIDGLAMMPGEVISFNELVGPRSEDNGFFQAGEIYKGEMRLGYGGGACQVASTFHAAAFFGGLEVVERSPHSRPSGYIGIGLDATVAFPHVDLKLNNPFPFPVVIRARIESGLLEVEIYGAERPATVDYAAATIGVKPYERKVREASWLAEGRVIKKQKGIRGITIRKVRLIRYSDGTEREERSVDTYPPTTEVYYVAPGTDVEDALPPLPEDATG
jgi:vancomycin resistance protein YoaR